ncbi:hypothetical protein GF376_04180 [Candidatus Peregrinibacteria bacterium]|nr:hypothetical protein [Candidatus Peregrinibacteria bacterium]
MNHKLKKSVKFFSIALLTATTLSIFQSNFQYFNFTHTEAQNIDSGVIRKKEFNIDGVESGNRIAKMAVDMDAYGNQYTAWLERNAGQASVYLEKTNAYGESVEDKILVESANTDDNELDIAVSNEGNVVVATKATPSFGNDRIVLRFFDNQLSNKGSYYYDEERSSEIAITIKKNSPSNSSNIILTHTTTNVEDTKSVVYSDIFTKDFGSTINPVFESNNLTISPDLESSKFGQSDVNFNHEKALVTYTNTGASTRNVYYRAVDHTTITAEPESLISESTSNYTSYPKVAGFYRNGTQPSPNVDSNFIITWQGGSSSDTTGIYAKKISCTDTSCESGNGVNDTENIMIRVNTTTNGYQSHPQIAAFTNLSDTLRVPEVESTANDYFNITWIDEIDPDNPTVKSQFFQGNMSRNGSEFTIAEDIDYQGVDNNRPPAIGMNMDGDLAVVYTKDEFNLLSQTYESELFRRIHQKELFAPQPTQKSSTAVGPNGNFAVVSSTNTFNNAYDSTFDIKLFLFDKYGNPIQNNVSVNTFKTGNQNNPDIAFFTDDQTSPHYGKFIVTWDGEGSEDNQGIYYRIYNADGTPATAQTLAHTATNGTTVLEETPSVSAGKFEEFVIVWDHEIDGDSSDVKYIASHNGNITEDFITTNTTTSASNPKVELNPEANSTNDNSFQFVVLYRDDIDLPILREVHHNGTSLIARSSEAISSSSSVKRDLNIDAAEINGSVYYMVSYSAEVSGDRRIYTNVYLMGSTTTPNQISTDHEFRTQQYGHSEEYFINNAISLDQINASDYLGVLLTWENSLNISSPGSTENAGQIEGQFARFNTNTNTFENFGPIFVVNKYGNTVADNIYFSSDIDYLSNIEEPSNGLAAITYLNWNGVSNKSYYQLLNDPFAVAINDFPLTQARQEILSGGKFLTVPNNIDFGNLQAGITSSTAESIQIVDLDGSTFSLTVSMTPLSNNTDTGAPDIAENNFYIKNNDSVNPAVNSLNPYTNATDFSVNSSTDSFVNLTSPRTLGDKNNDNTGSWEIYPEFQITVPSDAVSGEYTGTLTFTLA